MQGRYEYLDIAKGIGILTVVWAHILLIGWSHQLIYAFHMPLFFFISGMLFKKEKYSSFMDFIKRRFLRLFPSYVAYSIVTWVIWALFRFIRHDEVDSYIMPLCQTIIAQGSGEFMVHNSALWFVPCLFAVELMYFSIAKFQTKFIVLVCMSCAIISFGLGNIFGSAYWFLLPWNFDAALIAMAFYGGGNILAKYKGNQRISDFVKNTPFYSFITLTSLLVILYWSSMKYGECSMGSSSYNCEGYIFVFRAFVGIAFILLLSQILLEISNNRFSKMIVNALRWCGLNSLDIMCIHIPVKGVLIIICALLIGFSTDYVSESFVWSLIVFAFTMAIVCSMVLMINKFIRKQI